MINGPVYILYFIICAAYVINKIRIQIDQWVKTALEYGFRFRPGNGLNKLKQSMYVPKWGMGGFWREPGDSACGDNPAISKCCSVCRLCSI
jgi:hypothetical protein